MDKMIVCNFYQKHGVKKSLMLQFNVFIIRNSLAMRRLDTVTGYNKAVCTFFNVSEKQSFCPFVRNQFVI